jgi:hypothetical protein
VIPTINDTLTVDLNLESEPSKTYKLHIENNRISGYCDELEAMKQAVYKILNTERYKFIIYSWNYGIELLDLYGKSVTYVCSELPRRITEALIQDDRIVSVDNFNFDTTQKRIVSVSFTVHTIFGDVDAEKVVNY